MTRPCSPMFAPSSAMIPQVKKVMGDELRSLNECFKAALSGIGEDLESFTRLDANLAAKTLDDHLGRCASSLPPSYPSIHLSL